MSSPGAGKTSLLVATLALLDGMRAAVIEGDQEPSADAERMRATGVPALQVNTAPACPLAPQLIALAATHLSLRSEERRVGKARVGPLKPRRPPYPYHNN